MEKQEVIHSRESGLRFTHVTIKKVGRMKQAEFKYDFIHISTKGETLKIFPRMVPTTMSGKTAKECLDKVEEFFDTELRPMEYTIVERYLNRNVIKKIECNDPETWGCMYKAQKWCADNSYSYGVMDHPNPIAMWKGKGVISKWHNLSAKEKGSCEGIMVGDMREGPVFIYIFE